MSERLETEVDLLRETGREVEVATEGRWIVVRSVPLGEGWNRSDTDILIKIPAGYPTTPPDNFYAEPDLRVANGSKPGNAPKEETIGGGNWLQFSYHVEAGDWSPHTNPAEGHNLLTYLAGVRRRLTEAN